MSKHTKPVLIGVFTLVTLLFVVGAFKYMDKNRITPADNEEITEELVMDEGIPEEIIEEEEKDEILVEESSKEAVFAVTEEKVIPFETKEEKDETLEKGKRKVVQEGKNGVRAISYEITSVDGIQTGKTETGTEILSEPVSEIVKVGTKPTATNIPDEVPVESPKLTPKPITEAKPTPNPTPVIKVLEELKTNTIAFLTEEKKDEILLVGETEVEREGINGERTLKYKVTLTDGKETGRELISDTVTKEPVNKVVKVGTRVYVSYDEKMTKYLPAGYSFGEGGWPYALGGNGIYKGDKFVAGVSFNVLNMDSNLSHEEQLKLAEFFVIYRGGDTIREDVINALKQYHEQGGFGKSGLVLCSSGEAGIQIYYSNAG